MEAFPRVLLAGGGTEEIVLIELREKLLSRGVVSARGGPISVLVTVGTPLTVILPVLLPPLAIKLLLDPSVLSESSPDEYLVAFVVDFFRFLLCVSK